MKTITRAALACGLVGAALTIIPSPAEADLNLTFGGDQVLQCTGTQLVASLNPTIKDGTVPDGHVARYIKAAVKRPNGLGKTFLGGVPVPDDATTCVVDAGIRTNQSAQDVKYLLDNQTDDGTPPGGHATLTTNKIVGSLTGSTQCDSSVGTIPGVNDYPTAYPLQGKLVFGFTQTNSVTLKALGMQAYTRTYSDEDDAGAFHVTGTVIKGPGVGGRFTTAFTFLPTDSTKNINVLTGCTNGVAGDAAAAELYIAPSDSDLDVDGDPQPTMVTIGDDDANEVYDS